MLISPKFGRPEVCFGTRVCDEVDLRKLSETLMEVVDETMKPSHVSLWLKPPPKRNR